jgi:hypothetical protein
MEIATRSETQPKRNDLATYVLIHGGWHIGLIVFKSFVCHFDVAHDV